MRFTTKTSSEKPYVSRRKIIAMDTGSVNTHAPYEPPASGGVGAVELWDGDDALLRTDDSSCLSVFAAWGKFRGSATTLTRMVLRGRRQTREAAASSGSAKQLCALAE